MIGEGGYGKLYKGFIPDPTPISVAIKRVDIKSRNIFHQLRPKLLLLCQLHHPNLIPLIGYCLDDQQTILVYEFIPIRHGVPRPIWALNINLTIWPMVPIPLFEFGP